MDKGSVAFIKTSLGWLKGKYIKQYANGYGFEIEKVQRGSRRYLPKEAETIFPHMHRYQVIVKDEKQIRWQQPAEKG